MLCYSFHSFIGRQLLYVPYSDSIISGRKGNRLLRFAAVPVLSSPALLKAIECLPKIGVFSPASTLCLSRD